MNYALVFAGGSGARMGSTLPKQFIEIDGRALILYALSDFEKSIDIDAICVVCVKDWVEHLKGLIKSVKLEKVKWVVEGGETGQQSIYNGLKAIYNESRDPEKDIVLLSDGVRPFVSEELIAQNIHCVQQHGSSVTVCPVSETIVELNDEGQIQHIPVRSRCFLSKAPQGFYLAQLVSAHERAVKESRFDCTNSAELMARYGYPLYTVYDTDRNIKITTQTDILVMEAILENRQKNCRPGRSNDV